MRNGTMTISAYQIDNILKAYSRQSKSSSKSAPAQDAPEGELEVCRRGVAVL